MGSEKGLADEKPVHTVKITKNLEMDKYEVTQAEWLAVMHTIPEDVMSRGDNYPVHGVYMEIIDRFLAQLNGMDKAHIYRLPTEAEWEYACRAGIEGDNAGNLDEVAWYDKNSGKKIHEVGQKQPNKWGLYDMLGNVKEWCSDYYWEEYYQKSSDREDPQQMRPSPSRSVRGGDCQTPAILCRVSTRFNARPGDVGVIGLRLVREPKK